MRVVQLVITTLLVPILVIGWALAAWPEWLFWPALVLAALLVLTVALEWLSRAKPPMPLLPLAAMLVSVIAVALASPGATNWILLVVLLAIAASLADDIVKHRPRRTS